jgi:hypothetical protein
VAYSPVTWFKGGGVRQVTEPVDNSL